MPTFSSLLLNLKFFSVLYLLVCCSLNLRAPLWGSARTSNIETLQRFQNTVLRVLVNAPWYVPNWLLQRDLNIPSVRDVITRLGARYCGRLRTHPNHLANILLEEDEKPRRLKRFKPADLTSRFT
jgi:hypothetical protein